MNFKQGERFLPFLPFERGDKSQPPPPITPLQHRANRRSASPLPGRPAGPSRAVMFINHRSPSIPAGGEWRCGHRENSLPRVK